MPKLIPASTGCPTQNPKTTARATRIFVTLRTSTKMKLAQLRSSRVKRDASFVFGNAARHHFALGPGTLIYRLLRCRRSG